MSPTELVIGHTGTLLAAVTFLGLMVSGKWRLWYAFTLLLLIVSVHDSLIALWPKRFHRGAIWWTKEGTLVLVRFLMAVELTSRIFRNFPGAFATARKVLMLVLAVTFIAIAALPTTGSGADYLGFVGILMPRVLNGTVWLFAALAGVILWYRLPIDPFRKAIVLSYVPYLLASTVLLNALAVAGWQRGRWLNNLLQTAYVVLLLYWTYTAWRRDPVARGPVGPRREGTA